MGDDDADLVDFDEDNVDDVEVSQQLKRLQDSAKFQGLSSNAPEFTPGRAYKGTIPNSAASESHPHTLDNALSGQVSSTPILNAPPPQTATAISIGSKRGWGKFSATPTSTTVENQFNKRQHVLPLPVGAFDSSPIATKAASIAGEIRTDGDVSNFPSATNTDIFSSLVVREVPPQLNTIMKFADHFSKYGEVSDVRVDVANGKAFIEFADPASAERALNSPVPVFQNRFIKVERGDPMQKRAAHNAFGPPKGIRNMTYRAPALESFAEKISATAPSGQSVDNAATAFSSIEGLYDLPEVGGQGHSGARRVSNAAFKTLQKARTKVSLREKVLDAARKKLLSMTSRMKDLRGRLEVLAKQGKGADADAKASLMAELMSLTSETKTAQVSVISAEAELKASRLELEEAEKASETTNNAPSATEAIEKPQSDATLPNTEKFDELIPT